jgi:hypothetical protein
MAPKVLFKQDYPAYGYEVRTELVDNPDGNGELVKMRNAYTRSGDCIGDPQIAKFLCEDRGIAPEKVTPDANVCSIGFCENDQKWYGWRHRGICGFGVGSEVKRGDAGYVPDNARDLAAEYREWNDHVEIVDGRTIMVCVEHYTIVGKNDDGSLIYADEPTISGSYTVKTGRGEWTARTLDDARQMAIDFADSVS